MAKIVILVYDGCVAGAVFAPADLFMTANLIRAAAVADPAAKPLFIVQTASIDGRVVTSGNGQLITPNVAIHDVGEADLVIVPGALVDSEDELVSSLTHLEELSAFLRKMHAQGAMIAAGCTGSFILAESGLLDQLEATTTWWMNEAFCRRYPQVILRTRQMIVESGLLITAAAGTSYLDLSLLLIGKLAGPHISRQCAAYLCIDGPRESQTAYAIPHHRQARDPFIEKADLWIRDNISRPIDIPMLARQLGVSARTLVRRFKSALGQPPSDYIQLVRIDHAKYLLQNTRLGIPQIALDVGYLDEDAFRRTFRKLTSDTPASFRRSYNSF